MMKWLSLLSILVFFAGCRGYAPAIPDQAKYDLARPIDCSTAKQDINVLEQEKAESSKQLQAGVKMFVPASAARAILHGDYRNRAAVATGEYNKDIDNKIKQIKQECGL